MCRMSLVALIVVCSIYASGCGGSSNGNSSPTSFTISIQPTRVSPKSDTIKAGDSVQFLNQTQIPLQVVSGTLTPFGNPQVVHLIVINNNGFSPTNSEANLGDTVRFSNATTGTFNLNIVDDNGNVVSTLTIPQGQEQSFQFPSAGQFTVSNRDNSLFSGTVTVFGRPNPSNIFTSPVLGNGGIFTVNFPNAGSFPYFIQDPSNPDRSFITGTITVQ